MKLSSLMNRERDLLNQPSFLNESLRDGHLDNPIKVRYNPSWEKSKNDFKKSFSFNSREELKTFCNYVLDFESSSGVLFEMKIYSKTNQVDLTLQTFQVGNKTKKILSKIDAINKDTKESFRGYGKSY